MVSCEPRSPPPPKHLTDKRVVSALFPSLRSGIKGSRDYLISVLLKARDAPLHSETPQMPDSRFITAAAKQHNIT